MPASESVGDALVQWERLQSEGSFEESLEALEAISALLEQGTLNLDDSLRCYETGVLLARRCEKIINEAELRISRLDPSSTATAADENV